MKKSIAVILIVCLAVGCCAALAGCGKVNVATSDTLYVKKIENLPDDFIFGMDASCVPALEASGVKYFDFDGEQKDVFEILSNNGINYIRVRIWNDPFDAEGNGYGGGNCDIENAIAIGKRAAKYGLKLLVNFHYSDFWADPAKQMVPKAWKGMDIEQKSEALYEYTVDCLKKLKAAGVKVGMVQIGNETNGSMCGENGKSSWMNMYKLFDAGSRATRKVFPKALVAVHFANPEKVTNYQDYAKKLDYYNLDYDVFASSYYPYWHGTLENLSSLLSEIATTYGKKVMVAEAAYAYTPEDSDFYGNTVSDGGSVTKSYPFTVQGQTNCIVDITDTLVNKTTNAIGVFYWEGTWISVGGNSFEENSLLWERDGSGWAAAASAEYDPNDAGKYYGGNAADNQALFDAEGKPLESLKMFTMMRTGNNVELKPDAIEDVNLIFDLNGEITLPDTVNAVMSDNSKQVLPVEWQNVDFAAMRAGGVKKYDIVGTAGGMQAHCFVSMVEYNFVENYSFETGDETGWTVIGGDNMEELYNENKSTDSLTGTYHYHFWSGTPNTVEFSLEQAIDELPTGKYKYSISIMGGDGGATDIYAYVRINNDIVARAQLELSGYDVWNTAVIDNIEYDSADTIAVGIYVKCEGIGNGAWGKIDDALLNSIVG